MLESAKKRSIADVELNLDFFIHVFGFLSVLLIGADKWGISALGVNLRIDQIFLCIFAVLLAFKGGLRFKMQGWVIAFAFFSLLSTVFAFSFARSILFFVSILFNIVFLFYTFSCYVEVYGLDFFLRLWRKTCYTQFYILLLQFLLEVLFHYELPFLENYGYAFGIPRFQIWFYEPSYLATYLIFWFAFSAYMWLICNQDDYFKDVILALMMFVMSTSTSGFVGIAFVIFTVYIFWLARGITAKKLSFLLVLLGLFLVFRFAFREMYDHFIGRLFEGSLDGATGGRISRWAESWHVFVENFFFGTGPGCYGLYLGEGEGYVPSNVTLDLMSTLGILGSVAFYGLTFSLIYNCFSLSKKREGLEYRRLFALAYALIVFTLILQVNQGYLRLYHWLFFGVIRGAVSEMKKAERKQVDMKGETQEKTKIIKEKDCADHSL